MSGEPYTLSVDIGTTFTAAAVRDGGEPAMVGLGNRALQVPSVLFRTDTGFVVGEAAERRGVVEPRGLVREFKRRLGDPVPVLVDSVAYAPEALTATLLRWVVDAVTRRQDGPPEQLVLTHPASWGEYKLDVLRRVVTLAEVGPARWCAEPVAAAGQYASRSHVETGRRLGVYDLGGGTFDACVLEKTAAGFTMLGPAEGVEHLGGVDFDEAVFQQVRSVLGPRLTSLEPDAPDVVAGLARLRRECVEAKEALSVDSEATVQVALPGMLTSVRVTRGELEQLISPALEETVAAMSRAIRSAGLRPTDLDGIVLVGGSSRIPLVAEVLQRRFEVPTALDTHPKHDVALGALRGELWGPVPPGRSVPSAPVGRIAAPVHLPVPEDADPPAPSAGAPAEAGPGPGRRTRLAVLVGAAVVLAALVVVALVVVPSGRPGSAGQVALPSRPPVSAPSSAGSSSGPAGSTGSPAAVLPALPTSDPLPDDQLIVSMETKGRWSLYLASPDQPRPVRRLTTEKASDFTPVLSPDRRTVVYQHDPDPDDSVRTLGVMAADGTGARELFATVPSFCAGTMYRPGWSPVDPTLLAVPCRDAAGRYGLYLVRTDGSLVQALPIDGNRADDPTFGPDGRLVFWAATLDRRQLARPSLGDGPLWVRELDGTVRRLPGVGTARDADPAWSPDGTRLAFRRRLPNGTEDGNLDIDVLTLADGRLTKVVHTGAQEEDPTWSPDGTTLAFKSTEPTTAWPGKALARTWLVDADGSHRRLLLTQGAAARQTAPAWSRR